MRFTSLDAALCTLLDGLARAHYEPDRDAVCALTAGGALLYRVFLSDEFVGKGKQPVRRALLWIADHLHGESPLSPASMEQLTPRALRRYVCLHFLSNASKARLREMCAFACLRKPSFFARRAQLVHELYAVHVREDSASQSLLDTWLPSRHQLFPERNELISTAEHQVARNTRNAQTMRCKWNGEQADERTALLQ